MLAEKGHPCSPVISNHSPIVRSISTSDVIFDVVLKVKQLKVAPEKSYQFLVSWTCDQQPKQTCDIVGCAPPQPQKIHNNTNTMAPLTRGSLHSQHRIIAASVAAFETWSRLITGHFGLNRIVKRPPETMMPVGLRQFSSANVLLIHENCERQHPASCS